jgi:hypothetical protein
MKPSQDQTSRSLPLRHAIALTGLWLALAPLAQAHDPAAGHGAHHGTGHVATMTDQEAVKAVLMKTWDQPQARLLVDPVVVQGDVALAGWQQGERGGRALLRLRGQRWVVVICAGDGLKDAALLRDVGLPAAEADALARQLAQAEAKLDPRALQRFASFDGLVRMDEQGNHPPGHDAHAGHGSAQGMTHGSSHGNTPGSTGNTHGQHAH